MNNLPEAGRVPPSQSYLPIALGAEVGCWVVIELGLLKKESGKRLRPACRVRCSCGREAICFTRTLMQGKSTRCKHCAWAATYLKKQAYQAVANPMIPVGETFGRWTVIENSLRIRKKLRAVRVRCECGMEKILFDYSLRAGISTSCGCRAKERNVEAIWRRIYSSLRSGGTRRKLDVHLTLPQVKRISQLPCAYCGIEPSNVYRAMYYDYTAPEISRRTVHDSSMDIRYSGIDRLDSNTGYVAGNVVPCCADCNIAKRKMSLDDFLALIGRIRRHNPTIEGVHNLAATLFAGS